MFVLYISTASRSRLQQTEVTDVSHDQCHVTQFVKKVKELEVPPGRKMVSFDVTALFTSIPVTEEVSVIKDRLNQDTTLKDRCELSVNQIITLLEICLNTTYFIYDGVFYKQKKGAAMGSPVSLIVANLYMEHFEKRAIREAPHPPDIWLRYVDDTFSVTRERSRTFYTPSEFNGREL